jgi:hypothetical protein
MGDASTGDDWRPPTGGALDDTAWPEKLVARAVDPGVDDDRIHGYQALGDIAKHYAYSDLVFLAISGELPDDRASELFRVALCSFATMSVNEAPSHVSVLSRLCGGTLASAFGAGMIAVADQARHKVEAHRSLLAWLADPTDALPSDFRCPEGHSAWVGTLRDAVSHVRPAVALLRPEMTRDAARIALLFEAGLRAGEQLEAAIVSSRFCGLAAEALAAGPRDLGSYPVKLPRFHYVETVTEP